MTLNLFDQQHDDLEIKTTSDEQQILDQHFTDDKVEHDVLLAKTFGKIEAKTGYTDGIEPASDPRFAEIHFDCESSDGISRHRDYDDCPAEYVLLTDEEISARFSADESILADSESVSRR